MNDPFDRDEISSTQAHLRTAFSRQQHDMWSGKTINASPLRHDEIRRLQGRDLDQLDARDLDNLVFRAISTIGGVSTFKFFVWRFLAMAVEASDDGWMVDAHVILPKLDGAGFDAWPGAERSAVLAALDLWARQRLAGDGSADELWVGDDGADEIREWVKARAQTR